ncbi:MAG TPA: hypothetical protein VHO69_13785, partial [Phototrophicaceae bacterium]|nr:hypothetical protein [Phototrophicaceae bacterium]
PIRGGLDGSWQYQTNAEPTPLPPLNDSPRIGTTYQAFDNGFMIWLATTNDIYVYIGSESGVLEVYPHSQYAALRVNTNQSVSSGHFQPQSGFGRVWSNFVHDRIGQPVSSESGYLMTPIYDTAGNLIQFNLPDGNYARKTGTIWQVSGRFLPTPIPTSTLAAPTASPITPYPSPTPLRTISTWAAYQPFENGFMFWRQDTDEVYVLTVDPKIGRWLTVFNKSVYEAFPNPTDVPPSGDLFTPINAFGKVWSQTGVRTSLGWATAPEQGYNASISDFLVSGPKTLVYSHITTPTGRQFYVNIAYSAWSWLDP